MSLLRNYYHGFRDDVIAYPCLNWINSSSPSTAHMRQWIGSTLVKIIDYHLFGAKPLSKPMVAIVNWTLRNKFQRSFIQITTVFIQENASEYIVCEMAAILSRGGWVKGLADSPLKFRGYLSNYIPSFYMDIIRCPNFKAGLAYISQQKNHMNYSRVIIPDWKCICNFRSPTLLKDSSCEVGFHYAFIWMQIDFSQVITINVILIQRRYIAHSSYSFYFLYKSIGKLHYGLQDRLDVSIHEFV